MNVAEILHKPETLRKMLDERGVEHYDRFDVTEWVGSDGEICHTSATYSNGATVLVLRKCTTPEQAVEATLGRGTCHITPRFTCSECGHQYPTRNYECYETCDGRTAYAPLGYYVLDCKKPNFCPNCGRKVVEPTTNDVDAEVSE